MIEHDLIQPAPLTQAIFTWCVEILFDGARLLGISYEAINIWIFCIIWPLLTLALIAIVMLQRSRIRFLKARLAATPLQ
ncbi:MAG: hypothetical protein ACR2OZ_11585 [Verrucomicrobiales bacterium]